MRFLLLSALFLSSATSWAGYADRVIADGPIAYWRLGETSGSVAVDAVGGLDGSYASFVSLGLAGAVGDADSAIATIGSPTSKVTIPTAAALTPSTFTIELWAKPTAGPGAGRSPATYRDLVTASNISGWQLLYNAAGQWEFSIGRGNVGSGSAWNTIVGPTAEVDAWAHLVGSYDGSTMRFYVDGELVGSVPGASYVPVESFFFFINFFVGAGRSEDVAGVGDLFWIGEIDEVALYGYALDATTVQAHFDEAQASSPLLEPILAVDKSGATIDLSFATELSAGYELQRSSDGTDWQSADSLIGSGNLESLSDTTAAAPLLLYRIERLP